MSVTNNSAGDNAASDTNNSGFLLFDKPLDWSSAYASRWLGYALQAKTGHAGTLDPAATGLLVVGVGKGTKALRYLSGLNKTYHACVRMGTSTTTDDAEGEVVETRECKHLQVDAVRDALQSFVGDMEQTPPAYSAAKYKGKPLYYYARRNHSVPRKSRRITIESVRLLDVKETSFCFSVRCSSGTYIRVLARQLGEALGGVAHLASLRRVAVGNLTVAQALTPDECARLLTSPAETLTARPVDYALKHLPAIRLQTSDALRLWYGQKIADAPVDANANKANQEYRVYDTDEVSEKFIGVALANGELKPQQVFATKPCVAEVS